ncbi:response regulator receiver protein [Fibrisoma limi BUZ 3]|uniref:Response regulator receiver protein n=1 Tax=Fibrisoma limi BUZ 3 TaxID=1185876 RepID=I2GDN6_9BACT|nr:response regulator [Fibrisoma limi]CCH52010.1 response regulator receiver protein [Fibrisoma limi BUZ 3]
MKILKYICIVDDQADLRFLLQKLFALSYPNHPVRLFENGQALLNELAHAEVLPALILMDRHMPILDGYQTLIQLKQHETYQPIPVVMMSAEASLAEVRALYRAGTNSFVRKQVDFGAQMEMVSQVGKYWLETNQTE